MKNHLTVCYCIDNHYFQHFAVSLTSLILNNNPEILSIHLFYDFLSEEHMKKLKKIKEKYSIDIQHHVIDESLFTNLVLMHHFKYSE